MSLESIEVSSEEVVLLRSTIVGCPQVFIHISCVPSNAIFVNTTRMLTIRTIQIYFSFSKWRCGSWYVLVSLRWFDPITKLFIILCDHHLQKSERYIFSPKLPGESKNEIISEAVSKLQFYGTNCSASSEKKRKFAYFLKKTKKTVKGKKINRGRISRGSQNLRGYGAISQFYGRNNSQIQDLYSKPLGEWTPLVQVYCTYCFIFFNHYTNNISVYKFK